MKDYYISYHKADLPWAEWIAWSLEQEGFSTIVEAWDFRPGMNVILRRQAALSDARCFLAVVSPRYLENGKWVTAFAEEGPAGYSEWLPVFIAPCELEGLWASIVAIDLVGLDEASARKKLLAGLETGRPAVAPPFPGRQSAVGRAAPPAYPGGALPTWNIPHRNLGFTGRNEILSALRDKLASGRPAALTQAISGLGGVGKTSLAIEYAYQYAYEYRYIWWVPSEEKPVLESSLVALAETLDLVEIKGILDQRKTIEKLRRWLETHDRWLLIFDNVEEPSDIISYLPRTKTGHVLITSRYAEWGRVADSTKVPVFTRDEATLFILDITDSNDDTAAARLAEALGELPLAVEQAAFFIKVNGISIDEYLDMFHRYHTRLLEADISEIEYPATVATTWEISFKKLTSTNQAATEVLKIFAFLASEAIPRELLLGDGTDPQPSVSLAANDPIILHSVLSDLRKYSLINVNGQFFSIHRLVQAVIRDRWVRQSGRWALVAAALIDKKFHFDRDDLCTWEASAQLLPHALAVSSHRDLDLDDITTGRLFNKAGLYLYERADFFEARDMLKHSYEVNRRVHGDGHEVVATSLNDLGFANQACGDLNASEQAFEHSLSQQSEIMKIAIGRNNLGLILVVAGHRDIGRSHLSGAAETLWELCPEGDPSIVPVLSNLAIDIRNLGDTESRRSLQEAIKIGHRHYGHHHPIIATLENNAGLSSLGRGAIDQAARHFKTALDLDRETYGPLHPTSAIRLNNLGIYAAFQGALEKARTAFKESLNLDLQTFQSIHPNVARGYNNLALLDLTEGHTESARAGFDKALALCRQIFLPRHPVFAILFNNLGIALEREDDLEEARRSFSRAYGIAVRTLGRFHPLVGTVLNNLAAVCETQGDLALARKALEQALSIAGEHGRSHGIEVAPILNNLGAVLSAEGNVTVARQHLARALEIDRGIHGQDHPNLAITATNLAGLNTLSGDLDSARILLQKALEIDVGIYGENHLNIAIRLNNVGVVAHGAEDYEAARNFFESAIELLEDMLGDDHGAIAPILKNLSMVLYEQKQQAAASTLIERAEALEQETMPHQIIYQTRLGFMPILAAMARGGMASRGAAFGDFAAMGIAGSILCGTASGASMAIIKEPFSADGSDQAIDRVGLVDTDMAFEIFFRSQNRHALIYFSRRGWAPDKAQDLAQEAFMRFFKARKVLREEVNSKEHFYRIAMRVHVDAMRHQVAGRRWATETSVEPEKYKLYSEAIESLERDPLDSLLFRERQQALRNAVDELPPTARRCLTLRIYEDLKYREIAIVMEISVGSVKAHLHSARRHLHSILAEEHFDTFEL